MMITKDTYETFRAIAYCLSTRSYTPEEIGAYGIAMGFVAGEMKAWEEAQNEEAKGSIDSGSVDTSNQQEA